MLDLNVTRRTHATVCGGNQVYVLGGYNEKRLQSVECYCLDEQSRSWRVSCDMFVGLYGHTAVSYKHITANTPGSTLLIQTITFHRL